MGEGKGINRDDLIVLHEMVGGGVEGDRVVPPSDGEGGGDDAHEKVHVELGLVLGVHLHTDNKIVLL